MLRLSGLCKRFEDLPVLSNLSLTLSRGEIVALIGPSGCGKTTLLNIISGLTVPDAGTVEGADGRLSYMFQSARLLPWCTVEENIRLVRGLNAIIPASSPAAWPAGVPWPGHSTSAVRFS